MAINKRQTKEDLAKAAKGISAEKPQTAPTVYRE
jgi:hypothetical protein